MLRYAMLRYAMLCYAMLLLACFLVAAVVWVSTELLQEHIVTDVPGGTSVTELFLYAAAAAKRDEVQASLHLYGTLCQGNPDYRQLGLGT